MFSNAYDIACHYTSPVVISSKTIGNTVQCGGGAFVFLNREGWIVTVAHIFNTRHKLINDLTFLKNYNQEIKSIEDNQKLNPHTKRKKIASLKKDPNWFVTDSYWWGKDGVSLDDVKIFPEIDLAIGRLNPFNPDLIKNYPKIKNPCDLKPGTSLCKLGFPFHQINATYDEQTKSFQLAKNALPMPVFPIDGILTRFIYAGKTKDGKYDVKFIETSSPGLMGQSGGPIFDVNATIWGIQSHTNSMPLGFTPKVSKNGKEIEENQFINVGCGVHSEVLVNILTDNDIKFELS